VNIFKNYLIVTEMERDLNSYNCVSCKKSSAQNVDGHIVCRICNTKQSFDYASTQRSLESLQHTLKALGNKETSADNLVF
jgi:hypothetical protein